jgi:hypothetical protein
VSAPAPANLFSLTIVVKGNGTTNPAPGLYTYNQDDKLELTAKPDAGWRFDRWQIGNSTIKDIKVRVTINENKTATAYFMKLGNAII